MLHRNAHKTHQEKGSNSAVLDRPEPTPPDNRVSTKIRHAAADLMEQTDHRGREFIERDIETGTSAEVQRALIAALLNHLDSPS